MGKPVNPDLKQVEKLGRFHATWEEVAAWFGVDVRSVTRWMHQPEFSAAFEKGKAQGRISIRQAQLQTALRGNPTLLIWLGKQLLGQKDVIHQEHGGDVNFTDGAREQLIAKISKLAEASANSKSDPKPN